MKYLLVGLTTLIACSSDNPVAAPSCDAEKRTVYSEAFGGEPSAAWLSSDVWRLDPVHIVYFTAGSSGCTVTRQGQ